MCVFIFGCGRHLCNAPDCRFSINGAPEYSETRKMSWVTAISTLISRVVDKLCLVLTKNFSMSNCFNDKSEGEWVRKRERESEIIEEEVYLTAQTARTAAAVALLIGAWESESQLVYQRDRIVIELEFDFENEAQFEIQMWHASSWLLRNALNLGVRVKCEKRAQQVPQTQSKWKSTSKLELNVGWLMASVGVAKLSQINNTRAGRTYAGKQKPPLASSTDELLNWALAGVGTIIECTRWTANWRDGTAIGSWKRIQVQRTDS